MSRHPNPPTLEVLRHLSTDDRKPDGVALDDLAPGDLAPDGRFRGVATPGAPVAPGTQTVAAMLVDAEAPHRALRALVVPPPIHWVGDGFRVHQLLPAGDGLDELMDPFLLMDYHAPHQYAPTDRPRGVGVHPHRGFETVTLAFEGALAHHDSTGAGGVIRPGDVQWMTAASGILHKEYHEAEWARRGGRMHMMQLWVNLPAAHKMDRPGYQPLAADAMGVVELPDGAGVVRVIAGGLGDVSGPAVTFTPIEVFDVTLYADGRFDFALPAGHTLGVVVLEGEADIAGRTGKPGSLFVFDNEPDSATAVHLSSPVGTRVLVLGGQPIAEPVVAYGPFVMNSVEEIRIAQRDFARGAFGTLN